MATLYTGAGIVADNPDLRQFYLDVRPGGAGGPELLVRPGWASTDEPSVDLPLATGVVRRGLELKVFRGFSGEEPDAVSWDPIQRRLRMSARHVQGVSDREVEIVLKLGEGISVDEVRPDRLAPSMGLRLLEKAQSSDEWLHPEAPIRREIMPFFLGARRAGQKWRVELRGGVTYEFGPPDHWADVRGPGEDTWRQAATLAVWPPRLVEGWRYFAILFLSTMELGYAGAGIDIVFYDADGKALPADRRGGRFLVTAGQPIWMHVQKGDGQGVFRLYPDTVEPLGKGSSSIAIDVGSSTTVAWAGKAVDFYEEPLRPRRISGVAGSRQHWAPGLSSEVEPQPGQVEELPTSLLVFKEPAGLTRDLRPLFDATVSGPGLDLIDVEGLNWVDNLKWGPRSEQRTAFLRHVLLLLALRQGSSRLTLSPTYPLAFDQSHREAMAASYRNAAAFVQKHTGVEVLFAAGDEVVLFSDEATVLAHGAMQTFSTKGADEAGRCYVANLDLGGSTLDVSILEINSTTRQSTVLSRDSVRFAAGLLVDYLAAKATVGSTDLDQYKRGVIDFFIRGDHLRAQVKRWSKAPKVEDGAPQKEGGVLAESRLGTKLTTAGALNALPQDMITRFHLFGALLAELTARYVAGAVQQTLEQAPALRSGEAAETVGPAPAEKAATKPVVSILLNRSGNGWKIFDLNVSGWSDTAWLEATRGRITSLLGNEIASQHLSSSDRPDGRPLPKSITAERCYKLWLDVEGGTVIHDALPLAPNGFADENSPWWRRVDASWSPGQQRQMLKTPSVHKAVAGLLNSDLEEAVAKWNAITASEGGLESEGFLSQVQVRQAAHMSTFPEAGRNRTLSTLAAAWAPRGRDRHEALDGPNEWVIR